MDADGTHDICEVSYLDGVHALLADWAKQAADSVTTF